MGFLRSSSCTTDPEKMSRVCVTQSRLNVDFTRKAVSRFKQVQKDYEKRTDISTENKQRFANVLQSGLKSQFSVESGDVKSVTCTTNNVDRFDQMLILHPSEAINNQKFVHPISPILVQRGKCEQLVSKSFLSQSYQPPEVFLNTTKNELQRIK